MFHSTTQLVSTFQWLGFLLPFLIIGPALLTRLLAPPRNPSGRDLTEINRKLDLLIKHAGIRDERIAGFQLEDLALQDQLSAAIRRGNKIAAIKIYRQATGCGLLQAKNNVDDMFRRHKSSA